MQEFWEFPGGKLAGDESADEALRRELVEELGVEITSCVHLHSLEHDYPEMRVEIDFFLVRKWRGTPSGIEGQALRWLRPAEISPGQLLPADADLKFDIAPGLYRTAGNRRPLEEAHREAVPTATDFGI